MIEDNPQVSIVIPVYNGSNYLREAIDSALAQTYNNIEVIVVNDGSNDEGKSEAIVKSYGDLITYFHKENGGVSSALNLGIREMSGELFSWLSHDDKYYPWKIEKQVDYYLTLENKKSIIFSHQDTINAHGNIILKGKKYDLKESGLVFQLIYKSFIGGCTLLIPIIAFEETGYFSEKYKSVQDYDMWFRMINRGYSFTYLPITSGMSRVHNMQDTNTKRKILIDEKTKFFSELQDWLRKDLWCDAWNNKAVLFLFLALQYKKNNLWDLYRFNYNKGCVMIKIVKPSYKISALIYSFYVLLWTKYLSPAAYYYKGRLLFNQIKAKLL